MAVQTLTESKRVWMMLGLVLVVLIAAARASAVSGGSVPSEIAAAGAVADTNLKCARIVAPACQGLGYNLTAMPNLAAHQTQEDAEKWIAKLRPILDSGCSKRARFLLCGSLFPLCSTNVPRPVVVCRSLCETVRADCTQDAGLKQLWPDFLQCDRLPHDDKQELCMQVPATELTTTSDTHDPSVAHRNGTDIATAAAAAAGVTVTPLAAGLAAAIPTIVAPLSPTSTQPPSQVDNNVSGQLTHTSTSSQNSAVWPWQAWKLSGNGVKGDESTTVTCPENFTLINGFECMARCGADAMFVGREKQIADSLILALAAICFILTLFSLVTFWAETTRFGFPERPVLFLTLCYNLLSVCYLERVVFHNRRLEGLDMDEEYQCGTNPPCLASYITTSYLTLSAASWWVIFSLCWYLSTEKQWSSESLERKAGLFHILAWVPPLAPPIAALLWGAVRPHELTGLCTAPGFVEIPALVLLMAGAILIVLAAKSLRRLQASCRIDRLSQVMMRILAFGFIYFAPALLAVVLTFFEHIDRNLPPCLAAGQPCAQPTKWSPAPTYARLFFILFGGSLTGMWVWSKKTCDSCRHRINAANSPQSSAITKSTSALPKQKYHCSKGTSATISVPCRPPLYAGINFQRAPVISVHSRV